MSEEGEVAPMQEVQQEEGGEMDTLTALRIVIKNALIHDGLARGLRESAKALDRREAHLCVLASSCNEPSYVKLVEALCTEHSINLIKVPDNKQLGEWCGLCRVDKEGEARGIVACSCCVIKDFGVESPAMNVLLKHFEKK